MEIDHPKAISNATPLAALPALVLDLETTGLDVVHDRVVQIGAICTTGPDLSDAPPIDRLINPGVAIPSLSTHIHGITDRDVADAPPFSDAIDELLDAISCHVVVGHHIAFDLAVLRFEAARARITWRDPRPSTWRCWSPALSRACSITVLTACVAGWRSISPTATPHWVTVGRLRRHFRG